MQPTGVALVGRTAEQPSEGGSTLQTGHVVSFNRARGKYKVRWEDRTEANFAEDELAQILVNSQEDPYKLADGVPRKRGRPRKTENVPTEELSEQVVAGEAEAADTKPEGLGPTLRKRGRPKGTVKVERRGRPPKTPGTDVEPNVGNEPTDQDGISKAEARLGTKAVAAEKKGAKASGKVTSASPDLPLRRLRERPARGSPEVVSPPRKVAILSEGRRVIEVASGGEEESPVAKGKRRVQTNYKSGEGHQSWNSNMLFGNNS